MHALLWFTPYIKMLLLFNTVEGINFLAGANFVAVVISHFILFLRTGFLCLSLFFITFLYTAMSTILLYNTDKKTQYYLKLIFG